MPEATELDDPRLMHYAEPPPEWQPMLTAPRDGTVVIATWQDTWKETGTKSPHIHIEAMYCDEDSWWYAYDGDGPARPPTHWMPLPAAPRG